MTKERLEEIKNEHTKMIYDKKTGKDISTLCVTWDYFNAIHGLNTNIKKKEKVVDENEEIVLGYYYKEKYGKRTRNIPVNCAIRILNIVQELGKERHGDNYVHPPTLKKKEEEDKTN